MHHFFVTPASIQDEKIEITGDDFNHIKNVLRVDEKERVSIYDGQYNEYICTLDHYEKSKAIFRIVEKLAADNELGSRLYLFQGLPKNDKMELIIQKAVELGVYGIIPVRMRRCIVKYDSKKEKAKLQRWNAISESAAKQSARALIPEVHSILDYEEALALASELDMVFVPYEHEEGIMHTKDLLKRMDPGMSVGVFIGPEGGFEDSEIQKANDKGFHTISLGRRILRTETAGLCALSVLMFALER